MWTPGGQIDHLQFGGMRGGGKGGGGGSQVQAPAPSYVDPTTGMTFSSPQALNDQIKQDQQNAANTAAANTAAANATAAQNEQTFQQNKQAAYNTAMQGVLQSFTGQGVDPNQYMQYITPAMQQAEQTIPDLAASPASYFPTSLGQTIVNQALGDKRTQLTNQLNQTFTPNYASTALPSSTMDPAIQTILNNQFNPLSTELQNAMKRGTLTQQGYNAAVNQMNQDRTAGQAQLQTLGQNILSGEQASLGNIASGARSDIANMSLGQTIDPSQYFNQAQQQAQTDISGFGGQLQNAAGNATFADLQDLLNAGGSVQGASNPTAANPAGALAGGALGTGSGGVSPSVATDPAQNQTAQRGLGNVGAF